MDQVSKNVETLGLGWPFGQSFQQRKLSENYVRIDTGGTRASACTV